MKVTYPAIFHEDERGDYFIEFPDISNACTQGETETEGIEMAQEVLRLILAIDYIEKDLPLPKSSKIQQIKTSGEDFATLISVDPTPYVQENQTIRKNVSVPEWIAKRAEKARINFSETLTEALYKKLEKLSHD